MPHRKTQRNPVRQAKATIKPSWGIPLNNGHAIAAVEDASAADGGTCSGTNRYGRKAIGVAAAAELDDVSKAEVRDHSKAIAPGGIEVVAAKAVPQHKAIGSSATAQPVDLSCAANLGLWVNADEHILPAAAR